jgi:hypothetical protein
VWWYTTEIPVLQKLRQEDLKLKANLDSMQDPISKKDEERKERQTGRKEGREMYHGVRKRRQSL